MIIHHKYIKAIATSVICTIAAAVIMITFQYFSNNSVENDLMDSLLSEIPAQLDEESAARAELIKEYDLSFQKDLASVKYLIETEGQARLFERLSSEDLVTTIFLVGKDGTIINGTYKSCAGKKLLDVCNISQEDYNLIMNSKGDVNTKSFLGKDGELFKVFATDFGNARLVMPSVLKGKYASVYSLENMGGMFGAADERVFVAPIYNDILRFGVFKTEAVDLTDRPISDISLDESVTLEPSKGHARAMGYGFHYKTVQHRSDILGDLTILAICVDNDAVPVQPLIILLATILLITFLLQLYCLYIDEEPGKLQLRVGGLHQICKKGWEFDTEKARILLPFALISIVFVTLGGLYINSLNMVANQCWTSKWNIQQVSENLGGMDKKSLENLNAETEDMAAFLKITASILEDRQGTLLDCKDASRLKKVKDEEGNERLVEICNPWLAGLAKAETAEDISVFDADGRLIATSGTQRTLRFSRNGAADAAIFDVVDGVAESRQIIDENHLILSVPFTLRKDGKTSDAMFISRFDKGLMQNYSISESISSTFDGASESGHCLYMMTGVTDEHNIIYAAKALGADVSKLPDAAYADEYIGSHKIKDNWYFVATKRVSGNKNDYFILSFVPMSEVFAGRTMNTVTTFAVTLLVILALLAILLIYGHKGAENLRKMAAKEMEDRKAMTEIQLERLNVEIKKAPTSSQKILGVMGKVWFIILFLVTLVLIKGLVTNPSETLSGYLMSFTWQRGVNLFSMTTMIIIILSFAFILRILTKLISVLGNALNAGAETVCQLLVSLLRYAGYIIALFITLYMFGVDTTGVLASLGAFSVMVGLGAKNLITDILAGISIIMEKDYKMGDIVSIGGFCGRVNEIGIRTTKVEDIEGNVKIFYNSGVNGVINMTSRLSAVRMDVKLDSKHSFDQIEQELTKFFERIVGKYPQIKGECSYLGVQDSTPAFNIYRIAIPCDEIDRAPLRRALIKDFSEFCKEENMNKM